MNIKNNKGFSLLEVMVVVGIIGILTSVAVPAYNNYRDTAGRATLSASLANVEKAYLACMAVGSGTCDTLSSIGLSSCPGCTLQDNSGFGTSVGDPDFCLFKEQKIGSNIYKGCVSIEEQEGRTSKTFGVYKKSADNTVTLVSDKKFCYCDGGTAAPDVRTLKDGVATLCMSTSNCGTACAGITGIATLCEATQGVCTGAGLCQ